MQCLPVLGDDLIHLPKSEIGLDKTSEPCSRRDEDNCGGNRSYSHAISDILGKSE
jgi:hypothetical protein